MAVDLAANQPRPFAQKAVPDVKRAGAGERLHHRRIAGQKCRHFNTMRRNRRSGAYEAQLGGRPYTIGILPQGSNTNVCSVEISYPVGEEEPIVEALNIWAFLHEPELELQRNDFLVGPDNIKRVTLAWEHFTDKESTGLVFVQLKNADDSPLERGYDKATLLYSERTF